MMNDEKKGLIKQAIEEKIAIKLKYHNFFERTVNPHHLGEYGQDRVLTLSAWQTEGFSESGEPVGWKSFELMGIINIELTDETFVPASDYSYTPPHYQKIIYQIT